MFRKNPVTNECAAKAALAVQYLNNHTPCFGALHDQEEVLKGAGVVTEDIPPRLRDAIEESLVSAANLLDRYFSE